MGVSQQTVSRFEQAETIEEEVLAKIAYILGVTPEAIKNFSEEAVFNYFNTFHDSSGAGALIQCSDFSFNPIEKLIELFEENKKLYERLLQAEKEKNELLKASK